MLSFNAAQKINTTTIQNWIETEAVLNIEYTRGAPGKEVVRKVKDFIILRCDFNLRNCDPKFGEIVVRDLNNRDIRHIGLNSLIKVESTKDKTLFLPHEDSLIQSIVTKTMDTAVKIYTTLTLQQKPKGSQLFQEYNVILKEIMSVDRSESVVPDKIVDDLAKLVLKGFDIDRIHGSYKLVVQCRILEIFIEQNKKQEALEMFKSLPSSAMFVDDSFYVTKVTLKMYDKGLLPFQPYIINRIIKEYEGDLESWLCSEADAKEFIALRDGLKSQIKTVPTDSEYFQELAIEVLKTDDWAVIPSTDAIRVVCAMSFIKIREGNKKDALMYYEKAKDSIGINIPDLFVMAVLQLQLFSIGYISLNNEELKKIFKEYKPSYLKWIEKCHATAEVVEKFCELKKTVLAIVPEAAIGIDEADESEDSDSDNDAEMDTGTKDGKSTGSLKPKIDEFQKRIAEGEAEIKEMLSKMGVKSFEEILKMLQDELARRKKLKEK